MKSAKKILALILAGVMALALLTGCGKATSLNRTMAEGLAVYVKSILAERGNGNNISVSYQVPELSRNIAPLFDETWITKSSIGNFDVLNKTAIATLKDILSPYMSAPVVAFVAADVTDVKTPFMEISNLTTSQIDFRKVDIVSDGEGHIDLSSITSMKVAVTHKTVNGRTYALAVVILEQSLTKPAAPMPPLL